MVCCSTWCQIGSVADPGHERVVQGAFEGAFEIVAGAYLLQVVAVGRLVADLGTLRC